MSLTLARGEDYHDLGEFGDEELDARWFWLPDHLIEVIVAKLVTRHLGDGRTGCCSQRFLIYYLEKSTKSTSHSVTIDYGDKYIVDFNEITKYCSFCGAVTIDHQHWLCRLRWLSDWVTNSVLCGTEYRTILGIVRTIVRALTECLRVTYLTTFPISCQFLLTSLSCYCPNHKLAILESFTCQLSLFLQDQRANWNHQLSSYT